MNLSDKPIISDVMKRLGNRARNCVRNAGYNLDDTRPAKLLLYGHKIMEGTAKNFGPECYTELMNTLWSVGVFTGGIEQPKLNGDIAELALVEFHLMNLEQQLIMVRQAVRKIMKRYL